MTLVDAGRLSLDAAVQQWFPDFVGDGKDTRPRYEICWSTRPGCGNGGRHTSMVGRCLKEALSVARGLPLRYPPGTGRRYSDLGFMLLGEIMAREYGTTIDAASRRGVFEPLGMTDTAYRPRGAAEPTDRVVATSVGDWYERRMVETGSPYAVTVVPLVVHGVARAHARGTRSTTATAGTRSVVSPDTRVCSRPSATCCDSGHAVLSSLGGGDDGGGLWSRRDGG